jgi:hypothetical protein
MSDPEDVDALKARIAELEAARSSTPSETEPSSHPRGLSILAAVMIVVALVLAPLSVASVWAKRIMSDTDQYVKTTQPLIDNPGVRRALTDQVTNAVLANIDVPGVTKATLGAVAKQPHVPPAVAAALPGLQGALVSGIDGFVHDQVAAVIASPQFAQVWAAVNRAAHSQIVNLLDGRNANVISTQGDAVTLDLGPIIDQVKSALVAHGFTLASSIPTVNKSFVLMQSSSVTKAQAAYDFLDQIGLWLPLLSLVLLVGGILLARDKRAAVFRSGLGLAGSMLLLGVALAIGRTVYVDTTPANVLDPTTAGQVFDTLIRFLRTALRAVAVVGLVMAFTAYVSGPSSSAARIRGTFTGGIGSVRGSAESAGWDTGRFGTWTYAHRTALRVTAAVLGGLVLAFWHQPTAWVVLGIAVVVVIVLAIIEFLGRPPQESVAEPS